MKKIVSLVLVFMVLSAFHSFASGKEDKVEVRNYNTIRIAGNMEESNNIDPEHNKLILPYVVEEDKMDLLAGGMVMDLTVEPFEDPMRIIDELTTRGFSPTLYVYYSNDTKETDNVCIYENEDLIYYSRAAYNYSPIQTITLPGSDESSKTVLSEETETNLNIDIFPDKEIDSRKAEYRVYCSFNNFQNPENEKAFSNAIIKINGVDLVMNDWGSFSLKENLVLSVGDTVNVYVSHPQTGIIEEALVVPASMSELSVEPEMAIGVANEIDRYLLQWENQDCDGYDIRVFRADEKGELDSYGMSVNGTFHMWDPWELQEKGEIVPFLNFRVRALNKIDLEDIGQWSSITISSPSGASYGNYQTENL